MSIREGTPEITFKAYIRKPADVVKKKCYCNVCFKELKPGAWMYDVSFKRQGITYGGPVGLCCAIGYVGAVYRLINRFGF
jgi:hypothetical protein